MQASYKPYTLHFRFPAGTSRGIMHHKTSWFLFLKHEDGCATGIGECGLLQGLSPDDRPEYETMLSKVCRDIQDYAFHPEKLKNWPSIRAGLEMALADLQTYKPRVLYPSPFAQGLKGIPINGLIWMDNSKIMQKQIEAKLAEGFSCIKLKIGAIDWQAELELLKALRKRYSSRTIEIRVDANGAFTPNKAPEKLDALADLQVHSIEQPVARGQWEAMQWLAKNSKLPVALDEELLGVYDPKTQHQLLTAVKPHYIVLKPSLLGGFQASQEWIVLAKSYGIGWWITSALESNVGLNALAQWTYTLHPSIPQGLGTGKLYTNNFPSPLEISKGQIWHQPQSNWDLTLLYQTG